MAKYTENKIEAPQSTSFLEYNVKRRVWKNVKKMQARLKCQEPGFYLEVVTISLYQRLPHSYLFFILALGRCADNVFEDRKIRRQG